jgi:Flp pilus assembly protein CpaB
MGQRLHSGDVRLVSMEVPDGQRAHLFDRVADLEGRLVIGPVAKGEVVQSGSLLPPDRTPPFRQLTIPVDAPQAKAVEAGDTVDVLVTTGSAETTRTDVVVGAARILRITAGSQSLAGDSRPSVTFALATFEDVDRLVEASHRGTLTLVLANGFTGQPARGGTAPAPGQDTGASKP